MKRNNLSKAIIFLKKGTFKFICITSVMSLPALFLWALGVPGVQNEYARGWALGLRTLYHYMIGSFLLLITYVAIAKITQKLLVPLDLNLIIITIFWIFFIYSALSLYQAFQIILSAT